MRGLLIHLEGDNMTYVLDEYNDVVDYGENIAHKLSRERTRAFVVLKRLRQYASTHGGLKNAVCHFTEKKSWKFVTYILELKQKFNVDIDWEFCSKLKNISVKRLNKDHITIIPKYKVPKPTKEYLLKEIISNLEYSRSRDGYGDHDTEYYSACGWDDYVGEQKEQANSYAVGVWKAYKKLYLPHKKNYDDNTKELIQCLFFLRCNLGLFTKGRLIY
jgi:hypothetical protein